MLLFLSPLNSWKTKQWNLCLYGLCCLFFSSWVLWAGRGCLARGRHLAHAKRHVFSLSHLLPKRAPETCIYTVHLILTSVTVTAREQTQTHKYSQLSPIFASQVQLSVLYNMDDNEDEDENGGREMRNGIGNKENAKGQNFRRECNLPRFSFFCNQLQRTFSLVF